MEDKRDVYRNVYLNGEQTKGKTVVEDLERCAPDLVMHRNMIDYKPEDQLWLCEIKMKGNQDAMSDLSKFHRMASLNFQCYIFLYASVSFSQMEEEIRAIKINLNNETYKKTICISSYNNDGIKQIHCHSLEEILTKNYRKENN